MTDEENDRSAWGARPGADDRQEPDAEDQITRDRRDAKKWREHISEATGRWVLSSLDGQRFHGDTPLQCMQAEITSRIPRAEQARRIMAMVDEEMDEIDKDTRDAARYRWLRKDRHILMGCAFYSTDELDAAIDALIARAEES